MVIDETSVKIKIGTKELRQIQALAKKDSSLTVLMNFNKIRFVCNKTEFFKVVEFNCDYKGELYFIVESGIFSILRVGQLSIKIKDNKLLMQMDTLSEESKETNTIWQASREISILDRHMIMGILQGINASSNQGVNLPQLTDLKELIKCCSSTNSGACFHKNLVTTDNNNIKIYKVLNTPIVESFSLTKESIKELEDFKVDRPIVLMSDYLITRRGNYIVGVRKAIVSNPMRITDDVMNNTGCLVQVDINISLVKQYLSIVDITPKELERLNDDNKLVVNFKNSYSLVYFKNNATLFSTPAMAIIDNNILEDSFEISLKYLIPVLSLVDSEVVRLTIFPHFIKITKSSGVEILTRLGFEDNEDDEDSEGVNE